MRNKSIFAALALLLGFAAVAGCLSTDDLLRGAANLYGVDPSLVDEYLNGNIDPNDYIDAGGGIEGLRSFLPTSITLDVDDLPTGESERQLATAYRGLAGGARDIVDMFQNASQIVLDIGETVNADLTDPAQTTVEGTFELNGTTLGYKCDFAAYDFDGDGAADGSGNSQTAPVAYRIWTDNGDGYEPLMCGLMTSLPTNTSRGAGAFYAHPFTGDESAPVDQQIYIEWDRTDATHKWNLAYVVGTVDEGQNVVVDTAYARVDVRENDETGTDERTVRAAADFSVHPAGFETMQSSVHFQPGGGFFLLTAESTGAIIPFGVENVCVSLADASEATGGECDGFDTQDMTLLDVPIGDETAFPAEFAAVPTF